MQAKLYFVRRSTLRNELLRCMLVCQTKNSRQPVNCSNTNKKIQIHITRAQQNEN